MKINPQIAKAYPAGVMDVGCALETTAFDGPKAPMPEATFTAINAP